MNTVCRMAEQQGGNNHFVFLRSVKMKHCVFVAFLKIGFESKKDFLAPLDQMKMSQK